MKFFKSEIKTENFYNINFGEKDHFFQTLTP